VNNHRLIAAAVALTAAASLAACSSNSKSTNGSSTGPCKAVSGKPKLTYIPQATTNPYFQPISDALKEQAATLGYDYNEVGPSDSGASSQISYINSAVQNKVNAILISPNDPSSETAALQTAMKSCIKVISVNSDISPGSANANILPVDFSTVGSSLLELLGSQINYQGDFAILSAKATAVGQNEWIADLKAKLSSDSKYAKMKLVTTVYGDDDPDKSATVMQGLLTKYPNLKGVISPTAAGLPAAAKVLSQSKQKGKIALTGLALPNSMKPYVADGTVTAFQLWDPKLEGPLAAQLVIDLLGGKVPVDRAALIPQGTTVSANGKTYTSDAKGFFSAGDLVTFNKANIDQYNF
jgi:rhamnose transport system substrate-binding protein